MIITLSAKGRGGVGGGGAGGDSILTKNPNVKKLGLVEWRGWAGAIGRRGRGVFCQRIQIWKKFGRGGGSEGLGLE